jgi:hypothetical protein
MLLERERERERETYQQHILGRLDFEMRLKWQNDESSIEKKRPFCII